jgi:TPP-dependent indolepyruvate ferredoxin oxidoreductase alpha subunit
MGDRDAGHAHAFMTGLASRITGRPELTTDALGMYSDAVFDAFARTGVDYAEVHKVYANYESATGRQEAVCTGCHKKPVFGSPRLERAGTSD